MNKIAVTGATGFLGEKLVQKLIGKNYFVHAIARNESKLIELQDKFPGQIKIFPCPVEDFVLTKKALNDCSGIYHLASSKVVGLSEEHVIKTVQTNIVGTNHLLAHTVENKELKFIITTSTDKASQISGTYGATKFIVERLFAEYEKINSAHCKYRVVRLGNIFNSTSSVLVKWKKNLQNKNGIMLTEPEATRFFLTADQAIKAIEDCLESSSNSNPYVPVLKAVKMEHLLNLVLAKYGIDSKPEIQTTGLQQGENKHEFLADDISSEFAERWSDKDLLEII
jgi:UDP-N-acetylglucosamine 4,6-dehydratase/UDP-glucose 4-epimerase